MSKYKYIIIFESNSFSIKDNDKFWSTAGKKPKINMIFVSSCIYYCLEDGKENADKAEEWIRSTITGRNKLIITKTKLSEFVKHPSNKKIVKEIVNHTLEGKN